MTGEGIYFAIESGRQASLTIIDHLERSVPLTAYINRIGKIHKKMREQSVYNKFLYAPVFQWISIGYIRKHPKFVQRVLDNAISTYHTGYAKEMKRNRKF